MHAKYNDKYFCASEPTSWRVLDVFQQFPQGTLEAVVEATTFSLEAVVEAVRYSNKTLEAVHIMFERIYVYMF